MKILAATDGSKYGKWAIEWLAEMPFMVQPVVRVLHVVDELADALVDDGNGAGPGVQPGVGIAKDVELGHESGRWDGCRAGKGWQVGAWRVREKVHTHIRAHLVSMGYQGFRVKIY